MGRTWQARARDFGDARMIRYQDFGASDGIAVQLIADEAGDYRALLLRGEDQPTVITHADIFSMSVPIHFKALGEVVPVRVELVDACP